MSQRLVVVPRWAGGPASDWYPWLKDELLARRPQPFLPVTVAEMPSPDQPSIPAWKGAVERLIGDDPLEAARTIVVAHSVGCQAVMRALAGFPPGLAVGGVLFVAGWFWTDAPWDSLMPWIETPFDLERTKAAAGRQIVVLISDNDRHTSDWRANREAWQERLGAAVIVSPGTNHFNGARYPVILQTLLDRFATQGD